MVRCSGHQGDISRWSAEQSIEKGLRAMVGVYPVQSELLVGLWLSGGRPACKPSDQLAFFGPFSRR
jgi:hypothetical protein